MPGLKLELASVGSARGPGQLAAAEEVDVQVGHAFTAVGTVVDHDAVAGAELELLGK